RAGPWRPRRRRPWCGSHRGRGLRPGNRRPRRGGRRGMGGRSTVLTAIDGGGLLGPVHPELGDLRFQGAELRQKSLVEPHLRPVGADVRLAERDHRAVGGDRLHFGGGRPPRVHLPAEAARPLLGGELHGGRHGHLDGEDGGDQDGGTAPAPGTGGEPGRVVCHGLSMGWWGKCAGGRSGAYPGGRWGSRRDMGGRRRRPRGSPAPRTKGSVPGSGPGGAEGRRGSGRGGVSSAHRAVPAAVGPMASGGVGARRPRRGHSCKGPHSAERSAQAIMIRPVKKAISWVQPDGAGSTSSSMTSPRPTSPSPSRLSTENPVTSE